MQWLKAWLRKWLGIDQAIATEHEMTADSLKAIRDGYVYPTQRLVEGLTGCVENLREHYASVKEMGDACMARLDRETMKLATAIDSDRTGTRDLFDRVRADLLDTVKAGEGYSQRIAELESIVKDATLDTALAELEDRVARIEATPSPTPQQQGRRGGSAWNSHQVAASAGAARANGLETPLPTPGVS
jgi:hypothetical protein